MLFSILVANYNNAPFLKACFDSILKQTYKEIEVVFVDDCSTDNSIAIFEEYKSQFYEYSLHINEKNRGCGFTKKQCADVAQGEISGFIDPDDTLIDNAVELMIEQHQLHNSVSLIYSNHFRCNAQLKEPSLSTQTKRLNSPSYLQDTLGSVSHFATFKNNLYQKSRGINPAFNRAVDQSLYYALDDVGAFLFINKPLYFYRLHAGGISGSSDKFLRAKHWAIKAMKESFHYRIKNNIKNNISLKELKHRESDLSMNWVDYYASQNEYKNMYCQLFHSIAKFPSQNILLKIKYSLYPIKVQLKATRI